MQLALGEDEPPGESGAGVYRCAGEDTWCVVHLRDAADLDRLVAVTGSRDPAGLAEWAAARPPDEVMQALQEAGIPAGTMLRLPELLTQPQLLARHSFSELVHPDLSTGLPTGTRLARFSTIPDPPLRPAPAFGEHTREIGARVLGMSADRIDTLIRDGVLQTVTPEENIEPGSSVPRHPAVHR
jgi:hypothetical protein